MRKLILFTGLAIIFCSCNSQNKQDNSTYHKLCAAFLDALYDKKYNTVIASMGDKFINAAKDINLDGVLNIISDKLRNDYGGQIKSTFISSELTIQENPPTTFLIFRVESFDKFGYCFFYVTIRR
jgi:hypothetical protein